MLRLSETSVADQVQDRGDAILYRGVRDADGAPVLIKVRAGAGRGAQEEARIRREHRILKGLDAPGVARVLGLERGEGALALVLEDAPGEPLDAVLRRGPLDLETAIAIGAGLARALVAVHRAGVVHRDIRPANALFDRASGAVTIVDFSVAARLDAPARLEDLTGSLGYIAPEQTGRMDRGVDARSDLYALGVTLFEVLTGHLPFLDADPVALVHAHLARAPARIHDVDPRIPETVSEIVARLLRKGPSDRYQSASGLLFDLEACLSDLRETGAIRPRPLGVRDVPGEVGQRGDFVAREAEIAALTAAFDRAAAGAAEVVVLGGPVGIGKTALARHFAAEIAARGALVGLGRCSQTGRASAHAAIAEALVEVLRAARAEGAEASARLGADLALALGPSAGALVDLVPDAAAIFGATPSPQAIGPSEAKHRLAFVVERALAVLAQRRAVALVLSSAQWIDAGSLELLEAVLTGGQARRLLVILVGRDGGSAALDAALARIAKASVPVEEIVVRPLDREGTLALVADMIRVPPDRVREIADAIFVRTAGNPLLIATILRALHAEGALTIDPDRGVIRADFSRAADAVDEGSVVRLLHADLGRLSPRARRIAGVAAMLGPAIDPAMIATASDLPEDDIAEALDEMIRAGFAVRTSGPGPDAIRFAHDRVQRAALALIDEADRRDLELAAGRRIRARAGASPRDEELFAAADLLAGAAASISDFDERGAIAADLLTAGRRARARAAFAAGRRYFEAAARLLDDARWDRDPALSFAILSELCEGEASLGEIAAAWAHLEELERRARSPLDRVRAAGLRVDLFVREGRNAEAALAGSDALRAVGIDIPAGEDARRAALEAWLARDRIETKIHPIAARLDAPEMRDPSALAAERLLVSVAVPAYFTSPILYGLTTAALLDLCARAGHSELSALGYALHGAFLMSVPGRAEDARTLGKLAMDLLDRRPNPAITCRVVEIVCGNIAIFFEPMRDVLARLPAAVRAGIDAGDLLEASYICDHIVPWRIVAGDDLEEVEAERRSFLPLVDRSGDIFSMAAVRALGPVVRDLRGDPGDPAPAEDRIGDVPLADLFARPDLAMLAGFCSTFAALAAVVRGAWDEALRLCLVAEATGSYPGQFFPTELAFVAALARIQVGGIEASLDGPLGAHRETLRALCEIGPATYLSKHLLVEAEIKRAEGDQIEAMRLYDEAIRAAIDHEVVSDEAIAKERCADFHAVNGRSRIAEAYLEDAIEVYRRWGARGKVRAIAARLSGRSGTAGDRGGAGEAPRGDLAHAAAGRASALLDAMTAIRSAQAIASEVALARVIERLLRILVDSAGAERAVLLVDRPSGLRVAARLEPEGMRADLDDPIEEASYLAASIVHQVARTGEAVILADASRADAFARDPHVLARRPRSVLCLPIAHGGRRAGIAYLENNAARGVFSRDRLEPLGVVASQAAIAMENAALYDEIAAARADLLAANAGLSEEVARQTEALRVELRAREAAEISRAALAEEIILAQKDRIAELSVPLLPIAGGVVLVPLVGTMDAARADEVLETTLRGASAWSARTVILDVTGMKGAGIDAASALTRVARALRILGAEAVLTGIRPEAAMAMVEVGAELTSLTTRGTLRDGIAYALGRARRPGR